MKLFLSIAAALALLVTDSRAASTISFSSITLTNAVKTNDLLLVDSALGGTNYTTRTATIDTLKNALNIPSPLPGTVIASGTPAVGDLLSASDASGTNSVWLSTPTVVGHVNVKLPPYNAVGDGTTDDTTSISNAVNTGSTVYFPPGTYLTGPIYPTNNQVLAGSGWQSKLLLRSPTTSTNLIETGSNTVSILNLALDGNVTNYVFRIDSNATSDFNTTAIHHWAGGASIVENVYIRNFNAGIALSGTNDINGRLNAAMYRNNLITNCWLGIYIPATNTGEYCSFVGNQIRGGNYGLYNGSAANVLFTGNELCDNWNGIYIAPAVAGTNPSRGHSLYSGNIVNHAHLAVTSTGAASASFVGNQFLGNTTGWTLNTTTNFQFIGNFMEQGNITFSGGSSNLFWNNTMFTAASLSGNTAANSWFSGNRSSDTGPIWNSPLPPTVITNTVTTDVGLTINGFAGQTNDLAKLGAGGTNFLRIDNIGTILSQTDGGIDIGRPSSFRPANYYGTGAITVGGNMTVGAGSGIGFTSGAKMYGNGGTATVTFYNNGLSDFDRIQLGGTSASFPSLQKSGTNLVARLANDSADTSIRANRMKMSNLIVTPTGAELGANGSAMWSSNAVVYVSYSSDGSSVTTKQIAP